jgi:TM2 domain-containing membrane protein YozV
MALTDTDKKKIEEEERYRQEVKQSLIKTNKNPILAAVLSFIFPGLGQIYCGKIARGIVILFTAWLVFPWVYGIFDAYNLAKGKDTSMVKILIYIFILGILAAAILIAINPAERQKNSNKTTGSSQLESITEEYKDSLAKMFCDNRSDGKRYVDLQPFTDNFKSQFTETTKQPTPEGCKGIANYCLKVWAKKEDCENIANKKIWLGMTDLQLYYSWGLPKNKNNTVVANGVHTQWIYGDLGPYVYLEGKTDKDLKVTSWQD